MLNIRNYKKQISVAKPLNGGCIYFYENWANHIDNKALLNCVNKYKGLKISRHTVIKAYREYFSDIDKGFNKAILLTMIWGFNTSGYGPYRTNKYLSGTVNQNLISKSLKDINFGDVDSAFKSLKKIKYLGISYISKILYFAGKAKKLKDYPLIFDIRVAKSIVSLSTKGEFNKILDIKPINKLPAYKMYNILLHKWANEMKVDADQIEYFFYFLKIYT